MKRYMLFVIVGIMLFAGCSSVPTKDIQIVTEVNPKTNFDGYTTYTWLGAAAILRDPSGQWKPPAFDADTEIRHLIDRELRKRGMLESTDNPDLFVTFAVGVDMEAQKLKVDPKTEMEILENVPAGGLIVVFIDTSTRFVTWAGAATAELMEKPDTETAKARLDYVVTRMLKELPKK
ncbi:MAG: DUF4136 domain-containing protein [Planctomycetota bacterium]|jgi:hypothetical protein